MSERVVPEGFCHCGCGGKTQICVHSDKRVGTSLGKPLRFINGHNSRLRATPSTPLTVSSEELSGNFRLVPLTQGKVAKVDVEDYERIMAYQWRARQYKDSGTWYAIRHLPSKGSKAERVQRGTSMHRMVLNLEPGDPRYADHINRGETLDNRRSNLRIATPSQNCMNAKRRSDNKSGFKGVFLDKSDPRGTFIAKWKVLGKQFSKRGFVTVTEAAKYRMGMVAQYHGEFANNG